MGMAIVLVVVVTLFVHLAFFVAVIVVALFVVVLALILVVVVAVFVVVLAIVLVVVVVVAFFVLVALFISVVAGFLPDEVNGVGSVERPDDEEANFALTVDCP